MKLINKLFIILAITSISYAKVDLVTLPNRDTVQLTIYNSADMTLARESRFLTLKEGKNDLQFSWENTLIDPTSLEMLPKAHAGEIDIANLTFPPRVRNLGLWNINSKISGKVPIEITYLTSGLSWRAFYMGTLSENEEKMRLQGYVRVTNNSGEDYEDAQVRLIVGKVHMIDEIAALARRPYPYDRPGIMDTLNLSWRAGRDKEDSEDVIKLKYQLEGLQTQLGQKRAEVIKEGLSEYFLYSIEGTQTIENGWSKRMISFDTEDIPVINLYKYEEERYGNSVIRFLSFTNDDEHELGETPIPGGMLKVYRNVDEEEHLSYAGQSDFKYIPVNEEVELNLGSVSNVVVEPKIMDFKTENYRFDSDSIIGWDEVRTFEIEVRNTRDIPVKVEIKRNFQTPFWQVTGNDDYEDYDSDTIKFTLEMSPVSKQTVIYTLRTFHGTREDNAPKRSM
ncbi:MAG: DUF4139 domain-containing protein [Sedimentisphaerales bacterium]|nr:DUF4139 domain-containing protein [Sedimentisphaerales bacterium]